MRNQKWTEGKWRVVDRTTNGVNGYEICWSDDGECVTDHVYEKADAHLMSASKELYEALSDALEDIICSGIGDTNDIARYSNALKKARGEQQ